PKPGGTPLAPRAALRPPTVADQTPGVDLHVEARPRPRALRPAVPRPGKPRLPVPPAGRGSQPTPGYSARSNAARVHDECDFVYKWDRSSSCPDGIPGLRLRDRPARRSASPAATDEGPPRPRSGGVGGRCRGGLADLCP